MNLCYWWDTVKLWVRERARNVVLELTLRGLGLAGRIVGFFTGKKEK